MTAHRRKRTHLVNEAQAPYDAGPPPLAAPPLRFVDLFCGIGGFRIAFEKAGGRCVFSSDWDKYSQLTYAANFGEKPHCDIPTVAVADIPAHDILCGGFPCQPFSLAGVSKKNSLGRKHGFDDEKQGNLFFSIAEILDYHQPAAFVLENVKNLKSHDRGNTFRVIHDTLTRALGYTVYTKAIDARTVVPQHRERVFLVGFREPRPFEFPPLSHHRTQTRLDPRTRGACQIHPQRPSLGLPSGLCAQTSGRRQRLRVRFGDRCRHHSHPQRTLSQGRLGDSAFSRPA